MRLGKVWSLPGGPEVVRDWGRMCTLICPTPETATSTVSALDQYLFDACNKQGTSWVFCNYTSHPTLPQMWRSWCFCLGKVKNFISQGIRDTESELRHFCWEWSGRMTSGDTWENGRDSLSMRNHVSTLGLEIRSWEQERKWPQAKTIKLDISLTWWQLASKEKGGAGRDPVVNRGKIVHSGVFLKTFPEVCYS